MARFVIGISGASGIVLGFKTTLCLLENGHTVHLIMSPDAHVTALEELGRDSAQNFLQKCVSQYPERFFSHSIRDFTAPIASGTYKVQAMAIIPCSMATLAAISCGLSDSLLRRAADVTIKEGRKLLLVPRELPLSSIHLENMLKLSKLGVVILPPQPAWYTLPKTMEDMESYLVGRMLEVLGVDIEYPRWVTPLHRSE